MEYTMAFVRALVLGLALTAAFPCCTAHQEPCPFRAKSSLSSSYYDVTCNSFTGVVDQLVKEGTQLDNQMPAHLIRLMWHDCAVQGCDASVLLSSIPGVPSELEATSNRGFGAMVGAYGLVNKIKAKLESVCPHVVSCADILAAAAKSALVVAGGPQVPLRYGRRDGPTSFKSAPDIVLPHETDTAGQVCQSFTRMGLSMEDMVALIGTHTIGNANCWKFYSRLKGSFDPRLDVEYAKRLNATCVPPTPGSSGNWAWLNLDNVTSTSFDNQFFKNVQNGQGLLSTDAGLLEFPGSRALVDKYAKSQAAFFKQYRKSFKKLSERSVLTAPAGEVRMTCDKVLPNVS